MTEVVFSWGNTFHVEFESVVDSGALEECELYVDSREFEVVEILASRVVVGRGLSDDVLGLELSDEACFSNSVEASLEGIGNDDVL